MLNTVNTTVLIFTTEEKEFYAEYYRGQYEASHAISVILCEWNSVNLCGKNAAYHHPKNNASNNLVRRKKAINKKGEMNNNSK